MSGQRVGQIAHLLGKFDQGQEGPLVIVLGGIHGNEPAGVEALSLLLEMLRVENITAPGFRFRGRFLALVGNPEALHQGKRYLYTDLNRIWESEKVSKLLVNDRAPARQAEEKAVLELALLVTREIEEYRPKQIVFIDLHTTSASGGIFSIAPKHLSSIRLAVELGAPVVTGMFEDLPGTMLQWCWSQPWGIPVQVVAFEAGQQADALSVNRSIAAVVNGLKASGCIKPEDVENEHDAILRTYSKGLPKLTRVVYRHKITQQDGFIMQPGFKHFDTVQKGQHIAFDRKGPILAPTDGYLLMPLYQPTGSEGFFIVQSIAQRLT
jgi:succinylglutamate desuccinylase